MKRTRSAQLRPLATPGTQPVPPGAAGAAAQANRLLGRAGARPPPLRWRACLRTAAGRGAHTGANPHHRPTARGVTGSLSHRGATNRLAGRILDQTELGAPGTLRATREGRPGCKSQARQRQRIQSSIDINTSKGAGRGTEIAASINTSTFVRAQCHGLVPRVFACVLSGTV